jgi:uncharacterized protein (TIGR03382 family)
MGSGCLAVCANPAIVDCHPESSGSSTPSPSPSPTPTPTPSTPASPPATGEQRATGSACSSNGQCLTGRCLSQGSGFFGGMCSSSCSAGCVQGVGEVASACIPLQGGYATLTLGAGAGFCYPVCDYALSPTGCRSGYRCVARELVSGGDTADVCVPDAQAGTDAPLPVPSSSAPLASPISDVGISGGCSAGGRPGDLTLALLLCGLLVLRRRRRG